MYKLYKYPILVGGDGYTVSVEKPPIVLGSPVYTRYVEQPIYFGSLINTNNANTCASNVNNQTGGAGNDHIDAEIHKLNEKIKRLERQSTSRKKLMFTDCINGNCSYLGPNYVCGPDNICQQVRDLPMDSKSVEERKKIVSEVQLKMDDELEEIRRQIVEMSGGAGHEDEEKLRAELRSLGVEDEFHVLGDEKLTKAAKHKAVPSNLLVNVDLSKDDYFLKKKIMENIIIPGIGHIGSWMTSGQDGNIYNFNTSTQGNFVIKIALHSAGMSNLEKEIRIYNKLKKNRLNNSLILADGYFIFTDGSRLNFLVFEKYDSNLLKLCSDGVKIDISELQNLQSHINDFHTNNIILNDIHIGNVAIKDGKYFFSDFGRVIDLDDDNVLTSDEIESLKKKDFEKLNTFRAECRNFNFQSSKRLLNNTRQLAYSTSM